MTTPLQICVLAEEFLMQWQIDSLERVLLETDAEISLVVENNPETDSPKKDADQAGDALDEPSSISISDMKLLFELLREEGAWALVQAEQKLEWMLFGTDKRWEHMQLTPLEKIDCLSEADHLRCTPQKDKNWNEFPDDIIQRIEREADVIIRYGFGLIKGDILDATEHGVLSFHPADIRKYRGQGPEQIFLNDDNTAGVTLQRLDDSIDGGEIIAFQTTSVRRANTLGEVWAEINDVQIDLLSKGIQNLENPDFTPERPDELGEYYSHKDHQRLIFALRFVIKNLIGRIKENLY